MKTTTFGVLVLTAAAIAAPAGEVDREALRRLVAYPSVGDDYWYFTRALDGRVLEGGEEPGVADAADIRASAREDDAERWMDLAAACRAAHDADGEKDAVARAVAALQRRAQADPEDGAASASLGLALYAAGDDLGARAAVDAARKAPRRAWAGVAADAEVALLAETSRVAGRRIATLAEATGTPQIGPAAADGLDAAPIDAATKAYDDAVAAIEREIAIGPTATSVYQRRAALRRLRPRAEAEKEEGEVDTRKAQGRQPSDPFSVLLLGLDDAMSAPDGDGGRHVEHFAKLSPSARAAVQCDLARLREISDSADPRTSARALQATACLEWFCLHDVDRTVATLRRAIAKDPGVRQSWTALAMVLTQSWRGGELVDLCRERLRACPTRRNRLLFAQALRIAGRRGEARKEWLDALAADPRDLDANVGAAAFALSDGTDDASVRTARDYVTAARAGLGKGVSRTAEWDLRVAEAALAALAGDLDAAEKSAREMLAEFPTWPPPKKILRAIGR